MYKYFPKILFENIKLLFILLFWSRNNLLVSGSSLVYESDLINFNPVIFFKFKMWNMYVNFKCE